MAYRDGRESTEVDRDILDIIPERFDADADSRLARKNAHTRIILTISLAVLAVMAVGVAARHILFGEAPRDRQLSVPIIHADDKAIKVKPQDRGGMDVPNQDKLIYDRMAAKTADQPERLLPPPEQPITPPTPDQRGAKVVPPAAGDLPPAAALTAPTVASGASATATAPMPAARPPLPSTPPTAAAVLAAPTAAMTPKTPAMAAKAAPPVPAAPPSMAIPAPALKAGNWVVQLASLGSEAEAKAEWLRLKNVHKDQLGSLTSDILRVDLGAKGVHWRVRGGPLEEAQARLLCAELGKQGQGCVVGHK